MRAVHRCDQGLETPWHGKAPGLCCPVAAAAAVAVAPFHRWVSCPLQQPSANATRTFLTWSHDNFRPSEHQRTALSLKVTGPSSFFVMTGFFSPAVQQPTLKTSSCPGSYSCFFVQGIPAGPSFRGLTHCVPIDSSVHRSWAKKTHRSGFFAREPMPFTIMNAADAHKPTTP